MGVSKATTGGPGSGPLFKSFISFPYINKNIHPFMSFHFPSFFHFSVHFNFLSFHFFHVFCPSSSFHSNFMTSSLSFMSFHFLNFLFSFGSPFISFHFTFISFHVLSFLSIFHFNFIFPFLPNPDFWVLTCIAPPSNFGTIRWHILGHFHENHPNIHLFAKPSEKALFV